MVRSEPNLAGHDRRYSSGMTILDYLDQHLIPRAELLRAAALDDAQLARMQALGAVPMPSYRLALEMSCESFFGSHQEHAEREYYASGCAAWIATVSATQEPPQRIFERRYRARLAALHAEGFATGHQKCNEELAAHLRDEWKYFLDGTYGVCTKTGAPEDIAAKDLAVTIIKALTENQPKRVLTVEDSVALLRAVDLLDASSAPFAPHEVAHSSRRRLIDDVRAAYFPATANCLR